MTSSQKHTSFKTHGIVTSSVGKGVGSMINMYVKEGVSHKSQTAGQAAGPDLPFLRGVLKFAELE